MSVTTCIYAPNKQLKEDAAILAKLRGKSLSGLVWETLERMIEEDKEKIHQYKELVHAEDSSLQRS